MPNKHQATLRELAEENRRLRALLSTHLESKMAPVGRPSPSSDEEAGERPILCCSTCGWFLCATVSEVMEWFRDNSIAGTERGPDYRKGETSVARKVNLQRRGRVEECCEEERTV